MTFEDIFSMLIEWGVEIAAKIAIALAIYFIGRWLIGRFVKVVNKICDKRGVEVSLQRFFNNMIKVVFYICLVLTVVGVDYRREYEIEASGDYELRLPPVDSFNAENVYELTLRFNDGTVQTARIGHVRSYSAEGGEGAFTRVLSPVGDAKWNVVKKRAVMPVMYGTTSFKVNGIETDTGLDGAQGWYALKVATDVSALLELAAGGSVSSASLLGRGPGCFVILR